MPEKYFTPGWLCTVQDSSRLRLMWSGGPDRLGKLTSHFPSRTVAAGTESIFASIFWPDANAIE